MELESSKTSKDSPTFIVSLSDPVKLYEDWDYNWFDAAHQHAVLLSDSHFYVINYNDAIPTPKMFYNQNDLPEKPILAKISLDMKIIAVQSSLTNVLIIDTTNRRRWLLEIKVPTENVILPQGLIWSDHGGNSQDLVIVTSRGLELYKVSQVRGQCKLSRLISQPAFNFWYNPSFRMILLASNQYSMVKGKKETVQETVMLDGYFFRNQKSTVPTLELPPPDKAPRFELDPLSMDDLVLVVLYGRLCCLVHYTGGSNEDFISVYYLSKQSVDRAHTLSLNCITKALTFSVVDNLLVCHSQYQNCSFVFDIFATAHKSSFGASSAYIHPVGPCTPIYFTLSMSGNQACADGSRASSSSSSNNNNGINNTAQTHPQSATIERAAEEGADADASTASDEWSAVTPIVEASPSGSQRSKRVSMKDVVVSIKNIETVCFAGYVSCVKQESMYDDKTSPEDENRPATSMACVITGSSAMAESSGPSSEGEKTMTGITLLSTPVEGDAMYTGKYAILGQRWVWEKACNVMWKIKVHYSSIRSIVCREILKQPVLQHQLQLQRDLVNFLSRRGQRYVMPHTQLVQLGAFAIAANDPKLHAVLDYRYVSGEARVAKQQLLLMLYNLIEMPLKATNNNSLLLEDLIASLTLSYEKEFKRLNRLKQSEGTGVYSMFNGGQVNNSKDASSTANNNVSSSGVNSAKGGRQTIVKPKSLADIIETSRILYRRASGSSPVPTNNAGSGNNTRSSLSGPSGTGSGGSSSGSASSSGGGSSGDKTGGGSSGSGSGGGGTGSGGLDVGPDFPEPDASELENHSLEPTGYNQMFLSDIALVGVRLRRMAKQSQFSREDLTIMPSSNPSVITTRRDVRGHVVLTQSDVLSHVFLPILLTGGSEVSLKYCSRVLSLYICTLRGMGIALNPPVCVLLMNLLFYRGERLEVARLLQMLFFPDSVEVAMTAMELADVLAEYRGRLNRYNGISSDKSTSGVASSSNINNNNNNSNNNNNNNNTAGSRTSTDYGENDIGASRLRNRSQSEAFAAEFAPPDSSLEEHNDNSAVLTLRQCGIDILNRLGEKVMVVRWFLGRGLVLEAIKRCSKSNGYWKPGLPPASILGVEFFLAAILAMENMDAAAKKLVAIAKTSALHTHLEEGQEEGPTTHQEEGNHLDEKEFLLACHLQKLEILHAVFTFLKEWDPASIKLNEVSGKSKLATQTQFPLTLLDGDENSITKFKEFFGFTVS